MNPLLGRIEKAGVRRWCGLIFVIAALLRLAYVVKVDPPESRLFKFEVTSAARNFAATGELGNPYKEPTGLTAHLAPAFPVFIGLILRVTGESMWGWALKPLAALVSAACWALMPWIAVRFGLPLFAGVLAGLCGGVLPFHLWVETNGVWETPYAVLAMILLLGRLARLWERDERSAGAWFWLGILWGASILLAATQLPVLLGVLVIPSLWFARTRGIGWIKLQGICLAGALLALVPWTARNYVALGGFVPVRSNPGLEFALSFRDGVGVLVDFKTEKRHPNNSSQEAIKLREMGELAYMRMRADEAKSWMSSHPAEVLSLTVRRAATFWFMPYPGMAKKLALWTFTLFGMLGLGAVYGVHRNAALLTLSLLLSYPVTYYFHVLDGRYVYPVYWALVLMTCALVARMAGGRQVQRETKKGSQSRGRDQLLS
jgi:hypothetical protein